LILGGMPWWPVPEAAVLPPLTWAEAMVASGEVCGQSLGRRDLVRWSRLSALLIESG